MTTATETKTPPIDWFRNPGLTEPTPITVTPEGRVFGHIATWQQSHIGMPGRNVRPPRSRTDYKWFHRGSAQVVGDNGEPTTISVGNLTADIGHAPLSATGRATDAHYDNAQAIVARVNVGEDTSGIWFAGDLRPDLDEFTRWRLSSCGLSGDWRAADSGEGYTGLELRAALFVPCGGFPIPRSRVASAAPSEPSALVAAGAILPRDLDPSDIIVTINPVSEETENEEDAAMAKTDTTTKDTVEEPEAVEAPVAEEEATTEEQESHPAGNLVSIRDGEFVGLVTDTDTHDPATVSVQIEVPRELVASATPEQRALVSSAVQQKMRDRELDARFSELAGRVTAAESAAEKAWSHARGVEAMTDLDGII